MINTRWRAIGFGIWGIGYWCQVMAAPASESPVIKEDWQKQNYSAGLDMGRQVHAVLNAQKIQVDPESFLQGIIDGFRHTEPRMKPEELENHLRGFAEAQRQRQDAAFQAAVATHAHALMDPADLPTQGNPHPAVRAVVFLDYQCPHCKQLQSVLDQMVTAHPDLQVVYREFPILGQTSLEAAKAALAAQRQGRYLEMHQALMRHTAPLGPEVLPKIAEQVGLDMPQFTRDMDDPTLMMALKNNHQLAEKIQLTGSPTTFLAAIKASQPATADAPATGESPGPITFRSGAIEPAELTQIIQTVRTGAPAPRDVPAEDTAPKTGQAP